MAEPPQTQMRAPQVEPEPLLPVVSLAEAAHLDPAQAPALQGTGSWDGASMLSVVPYDPTWPQRFQAASAEILAATDHLFLRLEHIGSTSVPGLAAKPTREATSSALACTQRYGQNLWPPASARPCPGECLDAAQAGRRAACPRWPASRP
jgi:GrpB protein